MKICRQKEINEVIEARVTELLELIAADFRKSNFQSDLKFGVVLAGGGALQTGIEQMKCFPVPGHFRHFQPVLALEPCPRGADQAHILQLP